MGALIKFLVLLNTTQLDNWLRQYSWFDLSVCEQSREERLTNGVTQKTHYEVPSPPPQQVSISSSQS